MRLDRKNVRSNLKSIQSTGILQTASIDYQKPFDSVSYLWLISNVSTMFSSKLLLSTGIYHQLMQMLNILIKLSAGSRYDSGVR